MGRCVRYLVREGGVRSAGRRYSMNHFQVHGYGPVERNPVRTTTRQKESPTERKAQFEPVYNKLCVGTVFVASGNVTTET